METKQPKQPRMAAVALACTAALLAGTAYAGEVEVLHWWTSGGEAKAATELKGTMQKKGHTWKDFAVAGGGDGAGFLFAWGRMTVIQTGAIAGPALGGLIVMWPQSERKRQGGYVTELTPQHRETAGV